MRNMMTSVITRKGQITVPVKYRRKLKLQIGQRVRFIYNLDEPEKLILKPVADFIAFKGSFASTKKYNRRLARKAYVKDVVRGRV